jgi:hypothetical protein
MSAAIGMRRAQRSPVFMTARGKMNDPKARDILNSAAFSMGVKSRIKALEAKARRRARDRDADDKREGQPGEDLGERWGGARGSFLATSTWVNSRRVASAKRAAEAPGRFQLGLLLSPLRADRAAHVVCMISLAGRQLKAGGSVA